MVGVQIAPPNNAAVHLGEPTFANACKPRGPLLTRLGNERASPSNDC